MRFRADVADCHGMLKEVTVWDAAAREMLKVNGNSLLALWEECETQEGQTAFLNTMNSAKAKNYDLVLEITLREWKGKFSYQINVNAAHVIQTE